MEFGKRLSTQGEGESLHSSSRPLFPLSWYVNIAVVSTVMTCLEARRAESLHNYHLLPLQNFMLLKMASWNSKSRDHHYKVIDRTL